MMAKLICDDDTDNRVVYSTDLKRDQVMRFDPVADTVRIDGNTAPEGIANPGSRSLHIFLAFARSLIAARRRRPMPQTATPTA